MRGPTPRPDEFLGLRAKTRKRVIALHPGYGFSDCRNPMRTPQAATPASASAMMAL